MAVMTTRRPKIVTADNMYFPAEVKNFVGLHQRRLARLDLSLATSHHQALEVPFHDPSDHHPRRRPRHLRPKAIRPRQRHDARHRPIHRPVRHRPLPEPDDPRTRRRVRVHRRTTQHPRIQCRITRTRRRKGRLPVRRRHHHQRTAQSTTTPQRAGLACSGLMTRQVKGAVPSLALQARWLRWKAVTERVCPRHQRTSRLLGLSGRGTGQDEQRGSNDGCLHDPCTNPLTSQP